MLFRSLSKELKCSRDTIKKYLDIHNINKKERYSEKLSIEAKNIDISILINQYSNEKRSTEELGILYNCDAEYIRQILIKNNIKPNCGYNSSSYEKKVQKLLDDFNVTYICNSNKIISPYELDIYIPSHKIAIEINGIYFHSDKFIDKNYHETKRLL